MTHKAYIICKECGHYFKVHILFMSKVSFECKNCGNFPMYVSNEKEKQNEKIHISR